MSEPGIPTSSADGVELPCGRVVATDTFDMGMRSLTCTCGAEHAVVMEVHPLARWIPESVEQILAATIEPTDEYDTYETIHLMGMVLEEYPDQVAVQDASENPSVGWAVLWVTHFGAVELHELIVELLVELMDHAVGHAEDDAIGAEFDAQLSEFDVSAFVTAYRDARDFERAEDRAI